jgi:hypothetical protein
VVLRDTPLTTNLLTLSNDVADLVRDAIVPAGTYEQLRIVISGAYIQTLGSDGTMHAYATRGYDQVPPGLTIDGTLQAPSWDASGFKVKLPDGGLSITGEQKILIVDFDVAQSFGHATGGGDWVMRPVLDAFDAVASGSIHVAATPTAGSAPPGVVLVLSDAAGNVEGREALADPDGDGVYTSAFLYMNPAGSPFALSLEPSGNLTVSTAPAMPMPVDVGSGQDVRVALTVTATSP